MPLTHLPEVTAELRVLTSAFEQAGRRVFLVGGVVRDLWLDHSLTADTDIDLTTDALPGETKTIVGPLAEALWTQGERFGTIGCRLKGRDVEITTHRSEAYQSDSRKPDVAFSEQIEADLSRRDFTVNAMAIDLSTQKRIDPFDGATDLARAVLRTPIGAQTSFSDDPLRMIRAARFTTRYGLVPTDEIVGAMTDLADRIEIVAIERVGAEFDKLLSLESPGDGLLLLETTGLLQRLFPTLSATLAGGDQLPIEALARVGSDDLLLRWTTLAWFDADHDRDSVQAFGARLRMSNERIRSLVTILEHAASMRSVSDGSIAELRRWAFSAGSDRDRVLRFGLAIDHDIGHRVSDRLDDLAESEDLDEEGIPITGSEIMVLTGLEPGPRVGELLEELRAIRFEQGPLSREQAEAAIRSLHQS